MSRPVFGVPSLATVARRITWLPAAAVLALPFFTPGSPVSLVSVALEQAEQLTICGSFDGLRNGVPAGLTLTLNNPADAASTVRSVTVRVTAASDGCPADALSTGTWAGALVVPASGAANVRVPVTLHDATGRCANATWQLAYTSN
ncbi:MAG: hypothetical protein QOE05_699 [Actinomycetota bacterium]|nr:hypothetical protein [Actinomycetota bacterium]